MAETFFEELKRFVRWSRADEQALKGLLPLVSPSFREIAEDFYAHINEHEPAKRVFTGPEQVERHKVALCAWMDLAFRGPWDEAYFQQRARIGRMHVQIGLPQRYMFAGMNVLRLAFQRVAQQKISDTASRNRTVAAIGRILDIELAIMLETYGEAFLGRVQASERQEKSRLEHELALSEARYQEIVEEAWSLVATFDAAGTILLFNSRCEELTGVPRDRAVGSSWLEVCVRPEDRDEVRAAVDRVLAGHRAAPYEGELPGLAGVERRVRWHFTHLPSGGEPIVCALGIDVTEERQLQPRTRRAERLAALGTMAAGLAHEVRNPLNAASLQLTVVQRRLQREGSPDVDGAKAAADLVSSELRRLAGLVQEFLQFARPQALELNPADLRALARDLVELLRPEAIEAGVELSLEDGPPLYTRIDRERLKQVLHNLVRNAIEAAGPQGHVWVRIERDAEGPCVEVSDDGPGLPFPDAPIFEPFFTTKTSGTGLGLAIVHRIVTDHGGRITTERKGGRTRFAISLPAS